jgi:hypothetical protein
LFGGCSESEKWPAAVGANALTDGFAVPRFALTKTVDPSGLAKIEWSAPSDTAVVRCALFWCAPKFKAVDGASDAPGANRREITNFSDCAISYDDTRGAGGSLELRSIGRKGMDAGAFEGKIPDKMRVEGTAVVFAIGCWSFSEIDVNGATLLIPYFPSEIGSSLVSLGISPDCSQKREGVDVVCEVKDVESRPAAVGWCVANGECVPLCKVCAECQDIAFLRRASYSSCQPIDDAGADSRVAVCGHADPPDPTCAR